jgi:hypothetical protein
MAQTVKIPAFQPKQVVVLAVNRAESALRKIRDEESRAALVAELLGRDDARLTHVDLIAIDDLGEIGLAGFLVDGPGVPAEELAAHKARLEALSGFVLILYPGVFGSTETEITLGPDLTLIATLDQEPTSWDAAQTLTSAVATELTAPKKKPSDAAMSGRIAMLALLVIALLTLVMILIA